MDTHRITRSTRSGPLLPSLAPETSDKQAVAAVETKASHNDTRASNSLSQKKRPGVRTRSSLTSDEESENVNNEDNDDEDSNDEKAEPVVMAPPSIRHEKSESVASSNTEETPSSWVGPPDQSSNDTKSSSPLPNVAVISVALTQDEFESGSETAEIPNDIQAENDSDADYADVDQLSDISESSAQFEAEVEKDILEAGEDGIDWDDENIFGFDTRSAALSYGNHITRDAFREAPAIYTIGPTDEHPRLAQNSTWYGQMESAMDTISLPDSSTASDSSNSSQTASRAGSAKGGHLNAADDEDDGDTTDEEILPTAAIASPSRRFLSRARSNSDYASKLITTNTPPRVHGYQRPVMKNLTVGPKKAICYTIKGPGNLRHFRFIPPRNRMLRWVDIRSSRSNSATPSSVPSSPTFIDYSLAVSQGNTGTGAHITDVLHGRIFQQYHCRTSPQPESEPTRDTTEFGRNPFLQHNLPRASVAEASRRNSFLDHLGHALIDSNFSEEALALIDFEAAGVNESDGFDVEIASPTSTTMEQHSETKLLPSPLFPSEDSAIDPFVDSIMADVNHLETPAGRGTASHCKNQSISSNIRGLNLADIDVPPHLTFQIPAIPTTPQTPRGDYNKDGISSSPGFSSAVQATFTPLKRRFDDTRVNEESLASSSPAMRRKLS